MKLWGFLKEKQIGKMKGLAIHPPFLKPLSQSNPHILRDLDVLKGPVDRLRGSAGQSAQ